MNNKKSLSGRYRYTIPDYKINPINLDAFLAELHSMQLDMIEEAVEMSSLKEANDVIKHIMAK